MRGTLWERFTRYADMMNRNRSLCWPWRGDKTNDGYGRLAVDGTGKHLRAHRIAYEHLIGSIPEGKQTDHLCKNRGCVNPYHLEMVDSKTNTLRGDGPTAKNARKKRCKNGHPLSGTNLLMTRHPDGHTMRRCRTCNRVHALKHYYKVQAALQEVGRER